MKPKIKLITTVFLFLFLAHFANAALVKCGTTLDPAPCGPLDLVKGVFVIVNFLIGSATLVAIGFILYGGVRMILAAGDSGTIAKAKSTMTQAIIGLVIVILAYLIVTSVTSYLLHQSLDCLRTNFFNFNATTIQPCK